MYKINPFVLVLSISIAFNSFSLVIDSSRAFFFFVSFNGQFMRDLGSGQVNDYDAHTSNERRHVQTSMIITYMYFSFSLSISSSFFFFVNKYAHDENYNVYNRRERANEMNK